MLYTSYQVSYSQLSKYESIESFSNNENIQLSSSLLNLTGRSIEEDEFESEVQNHDDKNLVESVMNKASNKTFPISFNKIIKKLSNII